MRLTLASSMRTTISEELVLVDCVSNGVCGHQWVVSRLWSDGGSVIEPHVTWSSGNDRLITADPEVIKDGIVQTNYANIVVLPHPVWTAEAIRASETRDSQCNPQGAQASLETRTHRCGRTHKLLSRQYMMTDSGARTNNISSCEYCVSLY